MEHPSDKHKIFNISGCLTEDALIKYVKGQCNSEISRQIELHLTDCPLCSEAVEGLMEMKEPEKTPIILEETFQHLFGKQEKTKIPIIPITKPQNKRGLKVLYYGIAASFLLLAGSFFAIRYLAMDNKSELSMLDSAEEGVSASKEKSVEFAPPDSFSRDEIDDDDVSLEDKTQNNRNANHIVFEMSTNKSPEEEKVVGGEKANSGAGYTVIVDDLFLSSDADEVIPGKDKMKEDNRIEETEVVVVDRVQRMDVGVVENLPVAGKTETSGSNQRSTKGGNKKSAAAQTPACNDTPSTQKDMNDGLNLYKEGDYWGANEEFEKALSLEPDNGQALYYSGMSHFYNNDYANALRLFNQLLKNKNSVYYQSAQWQIAVIQIRQGETKDATRTLSRIIDENGTYRKQAEDEIQKLNQ